MNGINGNLPDTEETEYVVDAIGIEIFSHLAEAAYPPAAAVFEHSIPVVGGEAPVLSVYGEGIGRCTGLTVQVEVFRFYPGLYAVTADADGDITLQDDLVLPGVGMGSAHLLVEVELDEIPECHFFVYLRGGL